MRRRYRVEVRIYPVDENEGLGVSSSLPAVRPGATLPVERDFTTKELIDAADRGCREALVALERLAAGH